MVPALRSSAARCIASGKRWRIEALRSPDAAQRTRVRALRGPSTGSALREAVRCRAGVVQSAGAWYGPGSAERHEECRTASGTREASIHVHLQAFLLDDAAEFRGFCGDE